MKSEKGNEIKEWELHDQNQEEVINSEIEKSQENDEFVTIQTVSEKGKNGLKRAFGFLIGKVEKICPKKIKNTSKEKSEEKYVYKDIELKNISLYENDDIVEEKIVYEEEPVVVPINDEVVADSFVNTEVIVEENKDVNTESQAELLSLMSQPYENKYIVDRANDDENLQDEPTTDLTRSESMLTEFNEITTEISNFHTQLNTIIELEEKIEDKREKIIELKENIQSLKKQYNEKIMPKKEILKNNLLIIEGDQYNLRNSSKEISNLLQKCDSELSKIKKQRQETKINDTTEENKVVKINEEIDFVKTIIEENLQEQSLEIDEIKDSFNQAEVKSKRSILITGIHNFLSKTIDLGLNLLPSVISENKFDGMLGSIVVLNNRLRSIRKIIRKENKDMEYITYENIKEVSTDKTREMLEDLMHQLQSLKQEFIMEFYYDMDRYPESDDIMTEFTSIEYQITSKNSELDEMIKND